MSETDKKVGWTGAGALHFARDVLLKRLSSRVGLAIIVAILAFVVIGSLAIPYAPTAFSGAPNGAPNFAHIFGTDYEGHDVASMVVWGAYPSLFVSLTSSIVAVVIGATFGVYAGYYRKVEPLVTGGADILMIIPALPFMVMLGLILPTTNVNLTIILIVVLWAPVARAIRSQVLSIKERPFVEAAKLSGLGGFEIVWRVISPEIASLAFAYFVLTLSASLVFVTGLEFLGVGNVQAVNWGSILYYAQQFGFYNGDWWWILAPGAIITLFATSFALIGFSFEEVMNPRLGE